MSHNDIETNKRLVLEFFRCVFEGRNPDAARDFVTDDYIQNTDQLPSGCRGLEDFVRSIFPDGPVEPPPDLQPPPALVIAEGNMVVLAAAVPQPDGDRATGTILRYVFNAFRISDGKLAEHWGSVGNVVPSRASPPPSIVEE